MNHNRLGWIRVAVKMVCWGGVAAVLAGCRPSPHDLVIRGQTDALWDLLNRYPAAVEERDRLQKTALHTAAGMDDIESARLLLDAGADINARDVTGMTPLHVAAMYSRGRAAKLLLERGADLEARDKFGDTPLHTAAIFGRTRMVRWLLQQGADPCARNRENLLPADLARKRRHAETAAALEGYGCAGE